MHHILKQCPMAPRQTDKTHMNPKQKI